MRFSPYDTDRMIEDDEYEDRSEPAPDEGERMAERIWGKVLEKLGL